MMRRVARTAGQTVGREHAHEADPVDLSRLLRAYRERPRRRRAAEQRDELAATDVDCHLTLTQIASASAASCLLRLMYAFTYCAGISRTSWPSARNSRPQ